VSVVGVTGSGKTTFAAALAAKMDATHIELDALHWEPDWTMAELEVFRSRVGHAVEADRWVADGNYSKVRDLVWGRADSIIWLDYPFPLIFARLLRRTLARVFTGEQLWNGNRERFAEQFLSRDSLFLWAIKTYPKYRVTIPAALASAPYAHIRVVRLQTPRRTRQWLGSLHAA
jgi:adenylate kinase family enzyme